MSVLSTALVALVLGLSLYGLGHYLVAFTFALRPPRGASDRRSHDRVTVLIPSRDEGPLALAAIDSLLRQDHLGPVAIVLLLADREDNSLPHLAARFGLPDGDDSLVEIYSESRRRVCIAFTGVHPKSAKINWVVPRLESPFVAILDSDHRARPDWLRRALDTLSDRGARMVQARRGPMSAEGVFGLWDSLQQHVGCEVLNAAFTELGLTVFFTGTTVVMDRRLLLERPLRATVTEDIDFSYSQLMRGERMVYLAQSGSDEEVSPDLYSFLARRRRWASGHTQAFLRHLPAVFRAPLRHRDRLQFLLHGMHYLVALPLAAVQLVIAAALVERLALPGLLLATLVGALLSLAVARSQRTIAPAAALAEFAVLFVWFTPAVVILMNLGAALVNGELLRAALPLPLALQVVGMVGLLAPLALLLVGMAKLRQLGVGAGVALALTYPLAFLLDVAGSLLGMLDLARGRPRWRRVARRAREDAELELAPTLGIRKSWSLRRLSLRRCSSLMTRPRPRTLVLIGSTLVLLSLFTVGVAWGAADLVELSGGSCELLPGDTHPWIVVDSIPGLCEPAVERQPRWIPHHGSYSQSNIDSLSPLNERFWERGDATFPCNESHFRPANVAADTQGGIRLELREESFGDRRFTAGAISTTADDHLYGRYEVTMRAARASGVISAFFLYRFDPWQEIDAEFLGRDPTKMLVNVYYNPGEIGDTYNYGHHGTPALIDLGFDAAADFHTYAIEWEPDELRWYADGRLVHRRTAGLPTPIPHLPMTFHLNAWPICAAELAGPVRADELPVAAAIREVRLSRWERSPLDGAYTLWNELVGGATGTWRDDAAWIQGD